MLGKHSAAKVSECERKTLTDGGNKHDDESCKHRDVISDPEQTQTLENIIIFKADIQLKTTKQTTDGTWNKYIFNIQLINS